MDLDSTVVEFIESRTIPIFGVANLQGFAESLPGWHPKELMSKCESVVVFGHPFIEYPLHVEERTHIADRSWWDANRIVYRQVATWKMELFGLFDSLGLGAAGFGGFRLVIPPTFSYRIAQVEAGIGVYGRSGFCINPNHGCYYYVGVMLTEAKLTPTSRTYLDSFNPCEGCNKCGEVCPVKAIDGSKEPGAGYDRELCMRFVMKMSERSGTKAKICSRCYKVCPWSFGKMNKDG
jgi:epoxyqueuosine reductase QueG